MHAAFLVHLAHWKVAGRTLTPLEPSEAMQTLELGYVNAGAVLFLAALAATAVLGRFFCGWACHVVAYQDLCAWLLGRIGLRPRPIRSRVLAWVPALAAFYMFAAPTLSRWLAGAQAPAFVAHFETADLWATFPGPWIASATLLIDGFVVVWLLGSKGFCTYGCPYGALFALAERAAPGRIHVSDACQGCGQCTVACTSNVRVHEEVARFGRVVDPGCMRTLDCIAACPTSALSFRFGKPAGLRRTRRAWDFSWGQELALGLLFGAGLYAFRGLYGALPFLLALGLSVLCAFAVVAAAAAWGARDARWQHLELRRDGRTRAAGALTILAALAALLALGHSACVQFHAREGERLLRQAQALDASQRTALLTTSLAHYARAEAWAPVDVGTWQLAQGSIESALGRRAEAEARFRRAIEIDPTLRAPRLALADLLIVRGALDEARSVLRALLVLEPAHAAARARLERLDARTPVREREH